MNCGRLDRQTSVIKNNTSVGEPRGLFNETDLFHPLAVDYRIHGQNFGHFSGFVIAYKFDYNNFLLRKDFRA